MTAKDRDVSELAPPDDPTRMVFVNATLDFEHIEAIGFDMDYTLAIYNHSQYEGLAFELAVANLGALGYPDLVGRLEYRPMRVIRGLVIDRELGNVLKMDRYHHVSLARHGAWELDDTTTRQHYANRRISLGSERFTSVDTLFALPEVDLYSQLVALRDAAPAAFGERDYATIAADVRTAVDVVHRDGHLQQRALEDLDRYVLPDPELPLALRTLRQQGKKVFLLTNSHGAYTDRVMNHLLTGRMKDPDHWTGFFDDIVVAARKPGFFTSQAGPCTESSVVDAQGAKHVLRVGGNYRELHRRLGCKGDRILFVGDHIYGDVIRSKRQSFWRTVMVIPELEDELTSVRRCRGELKRFFRLLDRSSESDCKVTVLTSRLERLRADGEADPGELAALTKDVTRARRRWEKLREELLVTERDIDRSVHPQWGALMNDGGEISRFGQQVLAYADLYTGRVTNLARYPAGKLFQSPWDVLPHHSYV